MYLYKSLNPANNKLHKTFDTISTMQLDRTVEKSYHCFMYNQGQGTNFIGKKNKKLSALAELLTSNKQEYSRLITLETGKKTSEASAEIEKCV
jgi:succinate-semialdehyde dehydrogenase / glutarate-semialdehyde dehydrogenase